MKKPFLSDMPIHVYNREKAVRSTEVMMLAKGQTEAHVQSRRQNPIEPTPAMILGTVTHALVSGNTDEFVVKDWDARTKEGKKKRDESAENFPNAVTIDDFTLSEAKAMSESVMKNPSAKELIEGGVLEGSFFWKEGGEQFKVRPDVLSDSLERVADIKTAREGHFPGFLKAVKWGMYDLQAYQQVRGANRATDRPMYEFSWIVVEKEPPYMTVVYPFPMTTQTESTWEHHAERLIQAQKHDLWPGYSELGQPITEDLLR